MKVRLPKPYRNLPPSEQQDIEVAMNAWALDRVDKEHAKVQKIYLMLDCIVQHDYLRRSKEEILLHLANFREVYRINSQIKTEAEQRAWLDAKMTEIFGEGGFPYEYLDKLEKI